MCVYYIIHGNGHRTVTRNVGKKFGTVWAVDTIIFFSVLRSEAVFGGVRTEPRSRVTFFQTISKRFPGSWPKSVALAPSPPSLSDSTRLRHDILPGDRSTREILPIVISLAFDSPVSVAQDQRRGVDGERVVSGNGIELDGLHPRPEQDHYARHDGRQQEFDERLDGMSLLYQQVLP